MNISSDPVQTIRTEIETWESPFVELDCFGTDDAQRIVEIVTEFCRNPYLLRTEGDTLLHEAVR
jgi:hypothetical protein